MILLVLNLIPNLVSALLKKVKGVKERQKDSSGYCWQHK